ncbi:MraY family glycosyltransferase [Fictibacillus sp. Mic-4]|uniref:glycosyltransferase family 4 protein n=1 Tax=Fictibacillus TaxID=1329200 RepID=UPI0004200A8E|nr:MraY family glycosyltransferase [Fictibacillus gelatini]
MNTQLIAATIASFLTVLVVTPFIIQLAHFFKATDQPNERKVHKQIMPRWGGLGIFSGVVVGYFISGLYQEEMTGIIVGAIIILAIGMADDKIGLSPKAKLIGQIGAGMIVAKSGLTIDILAIPFVGKIDLGAFAFIASVVWIVAITNSINLIDGLDGLAAGVSVIVIGTIAFMAGTHGHVMILTMALLLIGSTSGFLFYNFNPAKIFMGDTGSLFLGYSISVLSLLGLYKSVTLFSFVVPIIILGVPVFDTTCAILRRIAHKKPISSPDKGHLHHRLMSLGLSHKATVCIIYMLSLLFSISACLFEASTLWGGIAITFSLLLMAEVIAELIGLVHHKYRPVLSLYKKISGITASLNETKNRNYSNK